MLQSDRDTQPNPNSISSKSPPINAPNFDEVNKESENLIPNSVTMIELFDIQIREIDEALMTYGNNSEVSETPTSTINRVTHPPTQHAILAENQSAHQEGSRATRKKKSQPMIGTNIVEEARRRQ